MVYDDNLDNLVNYLYDSGILFLFLLILFLLGAIIVITCIASWKLFKKAGRKGWEAIIPFYNSYVLVEIAGLNWWWFLLLIAPSIVSFTNDKLSGIAELVSLFAYFNCFYNIAKKFKKENKTCIFIGIFSFIFKFVFAFSNKEQYYKDVEVSNNGIFNNSDDTQKNNDNVKNNSEKKYCTNCGNKLESYYKFCSKCGKENK